MASTMASRLRPLPLRRALALAPAPGTTTTAMTTSRPFLTLPGSDLTQTLTATRVLPYPSGPLFDLIADVDDYSSFVPYCSRSRVTRWTEPLDPDSPDPSRRRRWPARADLHVGWGGFDEAFTSRLTCVPGVSVEALSGAGAPGEPDASSVFRSLVTRWQLRPLSPSPGPGPGPETDPAAAARTEVHLSIRYQFASPLYAAVSAAVSGKVANLMIEAFEKQARRKLGPRQARL